MKRGKRTFRDPAAHLDAVIGFGPGLVVALALLAAIGCEPDPSRPTETEAQPARAIPRRAEGPDGSKNVTRAVLDSLVPVERPHVVLIMVDTLRRDHVHAYGYPRETTPSIDALARSAIRYDRAYSQSSWTTPSTAAILTGRYPSQLGVRKQNDPLPDHATLLPEVLRAHDYRTAAVVSHVFISERWNFDQGYDEFDASNSRGHAAVTSAAVSDAAIEFIESSFPQGPSFLLVHYFDPHFDYIEHEGFRFFEDGDYDGWVRSGMLFGELRRRRHEMSDADFRRLLALYDSEIAFTDHHIGRVLDAIEALGSWDESLVVLSADHGEEFMEHDKFAHGRTLYEEQIHVPLVIKWPNAKKGAVSRRLVQSVDVLPSLLDYLGIPPPPGIAGAAIQGQTHPRPAFSETSRGAIELRSIRHGPYKLIWNISDPTNPSSQLYHVKNDPSEQVDLAEQHPQLHQRMQSALHRHFRSLQGRPNSRAAPLPLELSPEEKRHLEALGYGD